MFGKSMFNRSFVYKFLVFLIIGVMSLGFYGATVIAQGTEEPPDNAEKDTSKSAKYIKGGGKLITQKDRRGAINEGFEDGIMPPLGWVRMQTNTNETWSIDSYNPYSGVYDAQVLYDSNLSPQDEILLSPEFSAVSGNVSLWSIGNLYWCRDDYDNCDLEIWFVKGPWGGSDDVFLGLADPDWTDTWAWSFSNFDFNA